MSRTAGIELDVETLAVIAAQDDATLARWWCELNSWEWPAGLPSPEEAQCYVPGGRRSRVMHAISRRIGDRACARHWNRHMTDQEFGDFWAGMNGDASAAARNELRLRSPVPGATTEEAKP